MILLTLVKIMVKNININKIDAKLFKQYTTTSAFQLLI